MRILVAGGAGYVGSHVVRESRRVGHEVVVFDNYATGHADSIDGVEQVSGDVRDPKALRAMFDNFRFDAVVQLASSHSTREARARAAPTLQSIIGGTLNLARAMIDAGTERLVYGSTSAVVSDPESELGLAHGTVERLLSRLGGQYPLRHVNLRMFTVSGADLAGDIGQDQRTDPPLIPRLFRSALGLAQEAELRTQGGIPLVRDYVHVTDVARAHLQAIDALDIDKRGDEVSGSSIDLATGVGISETELAEAAASVVGNRSLPSRRVEAEEGVSVSIVGDPAGARDLLGWEPQFSDRETILETAWAWHRGHPTGFTVARSSSTDPSKSEKFGAVAIRLGFATPSDVQRALDRQDRESQEGGEHKLIGLHMLELGILSTSQLIEILRTYDETAAP